MHRIYVLDAATGKRLWMHEDTSRTFNRPLVQGGKLVMLAGPQEKPFAAVLIIKMTSKASLPTRSLLLISSAVNRRGPSITRCPNTIHRCVI